MLKLKLQYFGHLMGRTDSSEKTLMLGKIEGAGQKGMTEGDAWVWSLGWEDPLEKEMAIRSSILAWRITWSQEPGELHTVQYLLMWCSDDFTKTQLPWIMRSDYKCVYGICVKQLKIHTILKINEIFTYVKIMSYIVRKISIILKFYIICLTICCNNAKNRS